MSKLVSISAVLFVIILMVSASFGVRYNGHAKVADMPAEIKYEIKANKNIWPDQYYSVSYPDTGSRTFKLASYWTFEHSKYLFGGPVWVYHAYEINMTDVDFTVVELPR
jgi:TRAP-type mannitol/chloroaromatic compound transport system permease small subunit